MTTYADTSFLASLYGYDANSARATSEARRSRSVLLVTLFAEFELANAFEARVFMREITGAQATAALRSFASDIVSGVLVQRPVPAGAFDRAVRLAKRHTRKLGSRSLDILHVAIALELRASLFLTFDPRQARLAKAAGLAILQKLPAR